MRKLRPLSVINGLGGVEPDPEPNNFAVEDDSDEFGLLLLDAFSTIAWSSLALLLSDDGKPSTSTSASSLLIAWPVLGEKSIEFRDEKMVL